MTAGQHKGALLRTLLCKLTKRYQAILFIDDTPKHVHRMHEAFDDLGVDVVTIRYSREDAAVKAFQNSDKTGAIVGWSTLNKVIQTIFPLAIRSF
jgi:hypothetical protein